MAVLMVSRPMLPVARGTPSIWKLSMSKPRADRVLRPRSTGFSEMPMVLRSASATVAMAWSSMRSRVTTVTEGHSRGRHGRNGWRVLHALKDMPSASSLIGGSEGRACKRVGSAPDAHREVRTPVSKSGF